MAGRPLILVVNGPNLDKLGTRQPEIYGSTTLAELSQTLLGRGEELGVDLDFFQSGVEADVVGAIADASAKNVAGIIINPAALTHFSQPLRAAIEASGLPVIEVHISNIHAREPFRRLSLVSGVATGTIVGLGVTGYALALEAMAGIVKATPDGDAG